VSRTFSMNRTQILALIGALALLLAVLGTMLASRHKPEPVFCGRSVTQWLRSGDYETNRAAVSLAVIAIGKGAVPTLRKMLHAGTKWDRMWFAKAPRSLYRAIPIGRSQFDRKDRAMWALQNLGRDGRQATPDLLAILQDPTEHWNQRSGALSTLRLVEAEPSVVLPVMDRLKTDPVVGKFAASYARNLRDAMEQARYRDIEKSLTASRSTRPEPPMTELQPPSSFLDTGSLWESAKPKPTQLSLGADAPPMLLGDLGRSATNDLPGGKDDTNLMFR